MVYIRNGEILRHSSPHRSQQHLNRKSTRSHTQKRICTLDALFAQETNRDDDEVSVDSTVSVEEKTASFADAIAKGLGIEELHIRVPKILCFGVDEVVTIPFVYVVLICILYLFFGYRSFVFGLVLLLGFLSAKASTAHTSVEVKTEEDSRMPVIRTR